MCIFIWRKFIPQNTRALQMRWNNQDFKVRLAYSGNDSKCSRGATSCFSYHGYGLPFLSIGIRDTPLCWYWITPILFKHTVHSVDDPGADSISKKMSLMNNWSCIIKYVNVYVLIDSASYCRGDTKTWTNIMAFDIDQDKKSYETQHYDSLSLK